MLEFDVGSGFGISEMDRRSDMVTSDDNPRQTSVSELRPSLLPFDPAELTAVRVKPAEFARLVKMSKQTVSQWVKKGIISLGPDGRLDPAVASRQVFERSDLAKIRARVFKTAAMSMADLRADLAAARAMLAERERELAAEREFRARYTLHQDDIAGQLYHLERAIVERFDALVEARQAGLLDDALDAITSEFFYGLEPEPENPDISDDPVAEDAPEEGGLFATMNLVGMDSLDAP
jgi:hypothetical protein